MLPFVILSGGLATRLYPITSQLPKALIGIDGLPFIYHQLLLLKQNGATHVVICVGKFGGMIETYVGNGSRWGLSVRYSYDGEVLLGTGGAVKKATPLLPVTFAILYGDSYLDIDYNSVIQSFFTRNLPVMMTVYRNRNKYEADNIRVEDKKVTIYDKKSSNPGLEYVDYGLIIVRKEVFEPCPQGKPFDLSRLLAPLAEAGQVAAYEVENRFYEIGSIQGIRETEKYIRNHRIKS